jgi:drug/metabolite transporter (DMT)-like permease
MAAVSSAAVIISLARAEGIPALAIAALRLSLAALVVGPIALARARGEIRRLSRRDLALSFAGGTFLSLHFIFWITSLDSTSVMSSVIFVSTSPLFVGLASLLLLRERLSRGTMFGIALAVAGGMVVGIGDQGSRGVGSIRGDIYALLGGVSASGYLLVGRALRQRMSLAAYTGIVYTLAAAILMAVAFASGAQLFGHPWKGYLLVALLAAGPQLIGHTSYNWALKHLSATFVTVTLLAEPVGATILAIPILGQVPSPMGLAGGLLILGGIFVAARAESRRRSV